MLQEVWLDCRKAVNLSHVLGNKIHLYFAELPILLKADRENTAASEQVKTLQIFIFSKSIGEKFSVERLLAFQNQGKKNLKASSTEGEE